MLEVMIANGRSRSISASRSGFVKIESTSSMSAWITVTLWSFASSARPWASTIGSLST